MVKLKKSANDDNFFLFKSFLTWRVLLFAFLLLAFSILPLQTNFLGGGLENYQNNPFLWAWVNFDGEHYLSIAQRGYRPLTYFYFPAYPLLTRFLAGFSKNIATLAVSGLLISHAALFTGLLGLVKLIRIDYPAKIAYFSILLLFLFPTSFYLASFYTESLFFALVVWSFYFARKKRWILAGLLGALLTATRVVGLAIIPALLVEAFWQGGIRKIGNISEIGVAIEKIGVRRIIGIFLTPTGLLLYMLYLKIQTGDPLEFFHSVEIFGQQRSASLVLLPQVFYRYIFKVLPNIDYSYFPVVFTTWLEFASALLFLVLGILAFIELRLSYAIYLAAGYIIPTLSGSFSSFPRYVLVLFPAFILTAVYLSHLNKPVQYIIFLILFISLAVASTLFVRGYWVA